MTPIREYSPQIRNHPAPKNQPDGAAPFLARSHSHAPFRSLCNQTKTEPLRSRLPNTEQSGSVPRIKDGTTLFYLAPQPNTTSVSGSCFLVMIHDTVAFLIYFDNR
jgi:hypothetical protein